MMNGPTDKETSGQSDKWTYLIVCFPVYCVSDGVWHILVNITIILSVHREPPALNGTITLVLKQLWKCCYSNKRLISSDLFVFDFFYQLFLNSLSYLLCYSVLLTFYLCNWRFTSFLMMILMMTMSLQKFWPGILCVDWCVVCWHKFRQNFEGSVLFAADGSPHGR